MRHSTMAGVLGLCVALLGAADYTPAEDGSAKPKLLEWKILKELDLHVDNVDFDIPASFKALRKFHASWCLTLRTDSVSGEKFIGSGQTAKDVLRHVNYICGLPVSEFADGDVVAFQTHSCHQFGRGLEDAFVIALIGKRDENNYSVASKWESSAGNVLRFAVSEKGVAFGRGKLAFSPFDQAGWNLRESNEIAFLFGKDRVDLAINGKLIGTAAVAKDDELGPMLCRFPTADWGFTHIQAFNTNEDK